MRAWVYKVNSRTGGWHFDRYFRYRGRLPYDMGGADWIRSPLSWQRLRRVRRGDLFVCFQTDERKIYGLARAASPGYESLPEWTGTRPDRNAESNAVRKRCFAPALNSRRSRRADLKTSGRYDSVDFVPPRRGGALRLQTPVSVTHSQVRDTFRHLRAFTVPSRGTIHALAPDELRALLRACIAFNPSQRHAIRTFVKTPKR